MSIRSVVTVLVFATVVVTSVSLVAVDGTGVASGRAVGSPSTTHGGQQVGVGPLQETRQVGVEEFRDRLRAERDSLDALFDTMTAEEVLYARLLALQRERVVLRGQMQEHGSIEAATFANLTRFLRRSQDDPEKLDRLKYEMRRSADTLFDLQETVRRERELVDRLRALVASENGTLDDLTTPLASPLEAQRESQLDGLALLDDSLAEQEASLFETRALLVERAEYVGFYQAIWRDIDTQLRRQVLAVIERDLDESGSQSAIHDSRFENQRLFTEVLSQHHRARIATVDEFQSLVTTLEENLSTLGDDPSAAEVERRQSTLSALRDGYQRYRPLLRNESTVAASLRSALSTHAELHETRRNLLDQQRKLVVRLSHESRKPEQNRTLAALDASFDAEEAILSASRRQVRTERQAVSRLYEVFSDVEVDRRGAAYLEVRDRIADLLAVNLERVDPVLERELADLRSKRRTVARIENTWRLQARWVEVARLNETMRDERLEGRILRERIGDVRTVFGWLTVLREQADRTFAAEAALVSQVRERLESVESRPTRTTIRATTTTGGNESGSARNGRDARVFVLLLVGILSLTLLAWRSTPDGVRRRVVRRIRSGDVAYDGDPSDDGESGDGGTETGPTGDGPNRDGPNRDGPNGDGPTEDGRTDR